MTTSYSSKENLDNYIKSLDTYYEKNYGSKIYKRPSRNTIRFGELLKSYTFVNLPSLDMNPVPVLLVDKNIKEEPVKPYPVSRVHSETKIVKQDEDKLILN